MSGARRFTLDDARMVAGSLGIVLAGKIARAHLKEFPNYYERLGRMEEEAKAYWDAQKVG